MKNIITVLIISLFVILVITGIVINSSTHKVDSVFIEEIQRYKNYHVVFNNTEADACKERTIHIDDNEKVSFDPKLDNTGKVKIEMIKNDSNDMLIRFELSGSITKDYRPENYYNTNEYFLKIIPEEHTTGTLDVIVKSIVSGR